MSRYRNMSRYGKCALIAGMARIGMVRFGTAAGLVLGGLIATGLIATEMSIAPTPAAAQGVILVQGNACVSSCNTSHTQCRIATKGSASCDAQLQACLRACIKK
jgi:hypothetical protein